MAKLNISQSPIVAQSSKYKRERETWVERQDLATQGYSLLCANHGIVAAANRPTRIRDYTKKTRSLSTAIWAGAVLASAIFAVLNCLSLEGPVPAIVAWSVLFAILIGKVAHSTVAGIAKVEISNPRSVGRANSIRVTGGVLALVAVSVFCWLRFSGDINARASLPMISMIFEMGNVVFVAALLEMREVYTWADDFTVEYENAEREIDNLDLRIAACRNQIEKEKTINDNLPTSPNAGLENSTPNVDRTAVPRGKPNGSGSDHSGLR